MLDEPFIAHLGSQLSPARLKHSLGVMQVMDDLAPIYGLDTRKAHLAGLLHDAGKELPLDRMLSIAAEMNYPLVHPADRDPLYLHGPASAYVAQHELGITDPLILESIFRHSYVGDGPVLSPVFCWCLRFADLLEPGRDWDEVRDRTLPVILAGQMGKAAWMLMDWLVPFLRSIGVSVHPSQENLHQQLAFIHSAGHSPIPNDQLPV
jgi:predicted HD superfamily hydrolase involved in NAD metabolism